MGLPVNTSASRWCLTTVPERSYLLVNSKAKSLRCRASRPLSSPVCRELSRFSRIMIGSSMLTVLDVKRTPALRPHQSKTHQLFREQITRTPITTTSQNCRGALWRDRGWAFGTLPTPSYCPMAQRRSRRHRAAQRECFSAPKPDWFTEGFYTEKIQTKC
jgi:hypothetical protein